MAKTDNFLDVAWLPQFEQAIGASAFTIGRRVSNTVSQSAH